MSCLSATRCVFRTLFCAKSSNSTSVNVVVTFVTLQCHKVRPKCLQTNTLSFVSKKKTPIFFNVKRHVNVTATLKMSKNYYDILGVPRNASQKQIKDAYYKLAMKHHPDKNQGVLTQKFREIKEAYDVLSSDSSRTKYNSTYSSNQSQRNQDQSYTSNNWSSNSSYEHYDPYREFKWTNNRTQYRRPMGEDPRDYSYLRPYNVYINVIKVPKNVVKTQIDLMLFAVIKNKTLKLILLQLFQFIWIQLLKNLDYNILISSSSSGNNSLEEFIKSILGTNTLIYELTEMEALKGKAIRVKVNENEKVLVVNLPRGVKKGQSFYLFYLVDNDTNDTTFKP